MKRRKINTTVDYGSHVYEIEAYCTPADADGPAEIHDVEAFEYIPPQGGRPPRYQRVRLNDDAHELALARLNAALDALD